MGCSEPYPATRVRHKTPVEAMVRSRPARRKPGQGGDLVETRATLVSAAADGVGNDDGGERSSLRRRRFFQTVNGRT